jgi:dienelactone hydrolase
MSHRDVLSDFTCESVTLLGETKEVFRIGAGPAIILIPEIPGITPEHAELARRLAAQGYTVVSPSVFGEPGRPMTNGHTLRTIARACVAKEFAAFATGSTRPITAWLRALAEREHAACGGRGVGVIGMCFTGNFGLAMMLSESVVAPVLSQPSMPFAVGKKARGADLNLSADDAMVVARRAAEGCQVLGLRFTGDKLVGDRFESLRKLIGDAFIAIELPSQSKKDHSVLTEQRDEPSVQRVIEFFNEKLK